MLEGLDYGVSIQIHDEHGVKMGEPMRGRSAARRFFDGIAAAVDGSTVEIEDLRADGDRVLARVRIGGTLKETGRTGSIPAIHLFTLADGLITEIRTHRPDWQPHGPDA